MLLQHSTIVKVLSKLGVDTCKEFQWQSAIGMLARVRQGNKICSICKETFSSTQVLRTHIQGQHMEAPHLKCNKCDYPAGDIYALRIYKMKYDVTAPRFHYQHPRCGRSYTTQGHLIEHSKQHRGFKSPPCPNCGKTFTANSSLKSHLLSCGPGGQPLPKKFKCNICNKAYYRSGELSRHRRNKNH